MNINPLNGQWLAEPLAEMKVSHPELTITYLDVQKDPAARRQFEAIGTGSVPLILAKGELIVGWRRTGSKHYLASNRRQIEKAPVRD
jgi:hypothetical protein